MELETKEKREGTGGVQGSIDPHYRYPKYHWRVIMQSLASSFDEHGNHIPGTPSFEVYLVDQWVAVDAAGMYQHSFAPDPIPSLLVQPGFLQSDWKPFYHFKGVRKVQT